VALQFKHEKLVDGVWVPVHEGSTWQAWANVPYCRHESLRLQTSFRIVRSDRPDEPLLVYTNGTAAR
jgi:hypothetical protein